MRSGPKSSKRSSCLARESSARWSVEIDDLALYRPVDCAVRLVDEALQVFRMPVVAARLLLVAVHALLHDGPLAVVGDEEAVQIKVEAVLDGGAVDLCDQTAGAGQRWRHRSRCVRLAAAIRPACFRECWPRPPQTWMPSSSRERRQAALQGADDAGGDAGRMPVHAHDGAERLEPERMRQPLQEFVAAVVMDDRLGDDGAERRHARRQPRRHTSAVQG